MTGSSVWLDQAGPDDRAQLGVDGRVGLELAVRREPPVDLVAGALVGVLAAGPHPRLAVVAIDDRARQVQLAPASGPSCASAMIRCWSAISWSIRAPTGRSSSGLTSRTKRSAWPHISSSKTSLGRLNTSRKSSIPGPDTELTPASAAMQRAAERLGAGLRVEDRAVGQGHVRLRRQPQRLGDRDVRGVELERLDGRHRRAGDLHVERRRRAAEQDRRAGPDDLGHRDPGQDVDGVEDRRADDRDRRDQAHQRDRHDLDRDARLDAVDQVLARVLAVPEVAGRGDREDRHRPGDEVGPVAPEELHHLDHPRHAVLGEGARDDRLVRVGQGHVQPPGVRDLGLDVVVGRERRREVRDVGEPVGQPDVLDEVGRVREARLAGPVVEDLEPGRAGHEVDAVAAEVGVRLAVPVVQDERARRGRDRRLDDVAREQHPLAAVVERQAVLEQAPPHLRARGSPCRPRPGRASPRRRSGR